MADWLTTLATQLGVGHSQVQAAVRLLTDDHTVPFIVRYRRDVTGGLDEPQVRAVLRAMGAQADLDAKRKTVLRQLEKCSAGTEVLEAARRACSIDALEDIHLPYKTARSTKAERARSLGLEPLALRVWSEPVSDEALERALARTRCENAREGVIHLLAERVSEHVQARSALRQLFLTEAAISIAVREGSDGVARGGRATTGRGGDRHATGGGRGDAAGRRGGGGDYDDMDGLRVVASSLPPHRVLKLNRGENQQLLRVVVNAPLQKALHVLSETALPRPRRALRATLLEEAAADAYRPCCAPPHPPPSPPPTCL